MNTHTTNSRAINIELRAINEQNNNVNLFANPKSTDKLKEFFEIANKVGLVKNGRYVSGMPKGKEVDINKFYKLEDLLGYPKAQKINKDYKTPIIAGIILAIMPTAALILNHYGLISNF